MKKLIKNLVTSECIKQNNILNTIREYDEYTYEHSVSVAGYCATMAMHLHFSEKDVETMTTSALLHDVGKIFVPIEILNKSSQLSEEEFNIIKKHPLTGANYLKKFNSFDEIIIETVFQHHENFDGSGYPNHLVGNDINKFAKILRVMDSYDAMISSRPYHSSRDPREVITILLDSANKEFDQRIVKLLLSS